MNFLITLPEKVDQFTPSSLEKALPLSYDWRIRKVLSSWIEELDKEIEEASKDPLKDRGLKIAAGKVLEERRIELLSDIIMSNVFLSHDKQIDELKNRVMKASRPHQPYLASPSHILVSHNLSIHPLIGLLRSYAEAPILIRTFQEISSEEQQLSVIKQLSTDELYLLLKALYPVEDHRKIGEIITTLDPITLKGLVNLLTHQEIPYIRLSLLMLPPEIRVRLQASFIKILDGLKEGNALIPEIERLMAFVENKPMNDYHKEFYLAVQALKEKLCLEQDNIEKLERLMRFFEWDPQVLETFTKLTATYIHFTVELISNRIIERKLFDRAFESADDDAYDAATFAFENWGFYNKDVLVQAGIFHAQESPDWNIAKERFEKAGLHTVGDLKAKNIINLPTLKEYLLEFRHD